MFRILLLLLAAASAMAADDPWVKVRDLKSGAELRVYKKGSPQPVLAKMDQLTDENLIVVVKTEQVAIAREQIDRIDYRPAKSRITCRTMSAWPEKAAACRSVTPPGNHASGLAPALSSRSNGATSPRPAA